MITSSLQTTRFIADAVDATKEATGLGQPSCQDVLCSKIDHIFAGIDFVFGTVGLGVAIYYGINAQLYSSVIGGVGAFIFYCNAGRIASKLNDRTFQEGVDEMTHENALLQESVENYKKEFASSALKVSQAEISQKKTEDELKLHITELQEMLNKIQDSINKGGELETSTSIAFQGGNAQLTGTTAELNKINQQTTNTVNQMAVIIHQGKDHVIKIETDLKEIKDEEKKVNESMRPEVLNQLKDMSSSLKTEFEKITQLKALAEIQAKENQQLRQMNEELKQAESESKNNVSELAEVLRLMKEFRGNQTAALT